MLLHALFLLCTWLLRCDCSLSWLCRQSGFFQARAVWFRMLERMHDPTKYRFFGAHSNNEESPPVFPRPNAKGIDSTAPQGIIFSFVRWYLWAVPGCWAVCVADSFVVSFWCSQKPCGASQGFEHKGWLECASRSLNDWPLSERRCIIRCLWLLETHVVECWMPGLRFQVEGLSSQGCSFCEPFLFLHSFKMRGVCQRSYAYNLITALWWERQETATPI